MNFWIRSNQFGGVIEKVFWSVWLFCFLVVFFLIWTIHPSKALYNSCIISVGTPDSKQGLVTNCATPEPLKQQVGGWEKGICIRMTFPTDIHVWLPVSFLVIQIHQHTVTSQLFLNRGDKNKISLYHHNSVAYHAKPLEQFYSYE